MRSLPITSPTSALAVTPQRRRFANRHDVASLSDVQGEIHAFLPSQLQNDAFPQPGLEVREFRLDGILANRQCRGNICPIALGRQVTGLAAGSLGDRDLGTGKGRAGGIRHRANDFARASLAIYPQGDPDDQRYGCREV